ncbi:hypothetical protein HDF16_002460 [Granulicella aggregans]|uniref:Circularly permuted ATP-grasp superfamily protein n=1 Tax=Granulicella aggregans TaxID=474949 RepID=A0A7W8E3Z4_9BACT|nr:hypothetical protein [Granulicella aggregans]MBB5057754.1 hypothetical protein [Granulicella aggregans]
MLQPFRDDFNAAFTPEKYRGLLSRLDAATRSSSIQFRVAETPCFFPKALLDEMAATGTELTNQLVDSPEYMRLSAEAIPERFRLGNESRYPNFMTVDFGLVRDDAGELRPKLVEMQAFPSVFGYQDVLADQYVKEYALGEGWRWHLGGHDSESYWNLLRKVIVGDHAPENVVLLEVTPDAQKTLPDFHVYEDRLGIPVVDIEKVKKVGRRLLYEKAGRWIEIDRIFNRAIVDEMERKGTALPFDYRDELDVEWAGHPNWYFRISKFSLPYLDHPSVPKAVFLNDWFAGGGREGLPEDRERILLKPLYSFAGQGIKFAPTDEDLAAIPAEERDQWLLQERATFEPVIATPKGATMAEVRIMYLWPDGGRMEPVISLVRMGRGLMMGVDQNRNQEWVGGSAALFR